MRCPRGKASPETCGKQEICIASNMMLELLCFKWLCRDAGVRWRWSGRRALLASPQRRRWRVSGAASPHSLRQSHRCHKKLLLPCLCLVRMPCAVVACMLQAGFPINHPVWVLETPATPALAASLHCAISSKPFRNQYPAFSQHL